MAKSSRTFRLGTRGSQLAQWQANWVAAQLRQVGHNVELVEIKTEGDLDHRRSVEEIGSQGVFTKEIQRALVAGAVDVAVHSLKDLPTEPVVGLVLAAVPARESTADVLVVGRGVTVEARGASENTSIRASSTGSVTYLSMLPQGARVGTGSMRRRAQLWHLRPDLQLEDVRGNVDTRLRKLDEGHFDAIVLAEAGLRRLGLTDRIQNILPLDVMLPAVGQGALGIECRAEDSEMQSALGPLDDPATHAAVVAERALLAQLRGGCMAPVGALAVVQAAALRLQAVVLSADGTRRLFANDAGTPHEAPEVGKRVANALLLQGAAELIAASRSGN